MSKYNDRKFGIDLSGKFYIDNTYLIDSLEVEHEAMEIEYGTVPLPYEFVIVSCVNKLLKEAQSMGLINPKNLD